MLDLNKIYQSTSAAATAMRAAVKRGEYKKDQLDTSVVPTGAMIFATGPAAAPTQQFARRVAAKQKAAKKLKLAPMFADVPDTDLTPYAGLNALPEPQEAPPAAPEPESVPAPQPEPEPVQEAPVAQDEPGCDLSPLPLDGGPYSYRINSPVSSLIEEALTVSERLKTAVLICDKDNNIVRVIDAAAHAAALRAARGSTVRVPVAHRGNGAPTGKLATLAELATRPEGVTRAECIQVIGHQNYAFMTNLRDAGARQGLEFVSLANPTGYKLVKPAQQALDV